MDNKKNIQRQIIDAVESVKINNPMVGSITNTVTINLVANAQLAVGGSAAMVYLPDEAEFLAKVSGATYINVGTMFPVYEETLPHLGEVLVKNKKPWVLDPVAIGIGSLRTKVLSLFKEYKPHIISGNASEIIALAGLWSLEGGVDVSEVRGVDSTDEVNKARVAAIELARWTGGAVAVSGELDLVTDGKLVIYSEGGSHFMEKITGAGCSLAGVMAIYLSQTSPFIAALTATAIYNLAGKRAEKIADGAGSFEVEFLNELYKARPEEIADNPLKIEEA